MAEPFENNPWSAEHWNLTKQGEVVKQLGVSRAALIAKQAGATFGDYAKPPAPKNSVTVLVQRREINQGGGGAEGPVLPTALATDSH
jgi:hypothetical protein